MSQPSNPGRTNNKPVGRIVAVLPGRTAEAPPVFEEIGKIWETANANNQDLSGTLTLMPPQWLDPHFPRRFLVQFNRSS